MLKVLIVLFTLFSNGLYALESTNDLTTDTNNSNIKADSYEVAAKAFEQNKVNDAFIHLKNALKNNPEHLPSKLLMAKIFFDAGNMPAVEEELFEALDLGADINLVLPLLGSSLIIQNKLATLQRLSKYQSSFTKASKFEWAILEGQVYLIDKKQNEAELKFEQALALIPTDTRALNTLASLYLRLGWFDKSAALIKRSLVSNNNNEKTWVLKGELASSQGDLNTAIADFNKAFAIDPNDPKVLHNLAMVHYQQQDMQAVNKYTQMILERSPFNPSATLLNARRLIFEGNLAEAQKSLAELNEKLSQLDNEALNADISISFIQGASEYIQGNQEKARQYLIDYLTKVPNDLSAIRIIIDIDLQNSSVKKVIEFLEKRELIISNDFNLSSQLIKLYIYDNKLFRAESFLEKVQARFHNSPYLAYLDALIEKKRRQPRKALELLNTITFAGKEPLDLMLLRGELQLQLNHLSEAQKTADKLIKERDGNLAALNFVTAVYIKNNQIDDALAIIEKILAKKPKDKNARFNKALILNSQGKHIEFQTLIDEILIEDEQHIPSLLLSSRYELQQKNYEDSITWAKKILLIEKSHKQALEMLVTIYQQSNNWREALAENRQLLNLERLNSRYLYQQIEILIQLERFSDTERYTNVLFGLWSLEPEKLFQLSNLQVKAKNLAGALKTLTLANKLNNNITEVKVAIARVYFLQGNDEEAINHLNVIEAQIGVSVDSALLKGLIANQNNSFEQARKHFTQAFNLDQTNVSAIVELYKLANKQVGFEQFTQLIEKLVIKKTTPSWVRKLLADSYLNQQEFSKAQMHYEQLIADGNFANNASVINNLANIYAEFDLDKAYNMAKKAIDQNHSSPSILDTYGWILAQQQKYDQALPYLREAFTKDSNNGAIRYHIGYTLLKLDRKADAIIELQAAIAIGNNFAEFGSAKALLESL